MKNISSREIALLAGLASLSAVVQLIHLCYQSPQWGMWIDVVAVSWIMAFFLFGIRASLIVSLLGALIITLFAPDTWLGASMKWVATFPMYGSLFAYMKIAKKEIADYKKISNLFIPLILGILVRGLMVLPLNYFYAIPIWTGMTTVQAISAIPWYIIFGFNAVQAVLDVVLAWVVVFRFRIARFASWQ